MSKYPILILENSIKFKKGQIIENYKEVIDEGVEVNEDFVPKGQYLLLSENLSKEDERKVKMLVREMMKRVFWNLWTKNATILGNT